MIQLLGVLVAVGVILSIFTGPIGLALLLPAGAALFLVLRKRQHHTPVDQSYLGGAQPDRSGTKQS